VSSRAATPYQGMADADPKGASWPGWTRTSVLSRFKAAVPLPTEQPAIRALPQGRTGQAALTRGRRTPVRRAQYARRESNPHQLGPQPSPSTCLRHERMEPPPGVEPGLLPYEGRAASRARRRSWGTWTRTRTSVAVSRFRAGRVASYTIPHRYAGRDLNPQTARFELASFAELALPALACATWDLNPDRTQVKSLSLCH
jgi:hypothetical protein